MTNAMLRNSVLAAAALTAAILVTGCDVNLNATGAAGQASAAVAQPSQPSAQSPSPVSSPTPRPRPTGILVDPSSLSVPSGNLYLRIDELNANFYQPTDFKLPDGTYTVMTYGRNAVYGTFNVSRNQVIQVTGALVRTDSGVGFDLSRLTTVSVDPTPLTQPAGQAYVRVREIYTAFASKMEFHLPAGQYTVQTYSGGISYGNFTVESWGLGAVTGALERVSDGVSL